MLSEYKYRIVERLDGRFEVQKKPNVLLSLLYPWESITSFLELKNAKNHINLLKDDDWRERMKINGNKVKRVIAC